MSFKNKKNIVNYVDEFNLNSLIEIPQKNNPNDGEIIRAFKKLKTNIQFLNVNNKNSKAIYITSSYKNEGKSFVTANLGISYAEIGKKVLIIDSDLKNGIQSKIFRIPNYLGFSNMLSGIDDDGKEIDDSPNNYIKETEIKNLFIITSGTIPPNPAELLSLPKLPKIIKHLSKIFDIIIIDGTSTLITDEALILSRVIGTTLLVVDYNNTNKREFIQAKEDIENVGGNILGVIINRVKQVEKISIIKRIVNSINKLFNNFIYKIKSSISLKRTKLLEEGRFNDNYNKKDIIFYRKEKKDKIDNLYIKKDINLFDVEDNLFKENNEIVDLKKQSSKIATDDYINNVDRFNNDDNINTNYNNEDIDFYDIEESDAVQDNADIEESDVVQDNADIEESDVVQDSDDIQDNIIDKKINSTLKKHDNPSKINNASNSNLKELNIFNNTENLNKDSSNFIKEINKKHEKYYEHDNKEEIIINVNNTDTSNDTNIAIISNSDIDNNTENILKLEKNGVINNSQIDVNNSNIDNDDKVIVKPAIILKAIKNRISGNDKTKDNKQITFHKKKDIIKKENNKKIVNIELPNNDDINSIEINGANRLDEMVVVIVDAEKAICIAFNNNCYVEKQVRGFDKSDGFYKEQYSLHYKSRKLKALMNMYNISKKQALKVDPLVYSTLMDLDEKIWIEEKKENNIADIYVKCIVAEYDKKIDESYAEYKYRCNTLRYNSLKIMGIELEYKTEALFNSKYMSFSDKVQMSKFSKSLKTKRNNNKNINNEKQTNYKQNIEKNNNIESNIIEINPNNNIENQDTNKIESINFEDIIKKENKEYNENIADSLESELNNENRMIEEKNNNSISLYDKILEREKQKKIKIEKKKEAEVLRKVQKERNEVKKKKLKLEKEKKSEEKKKIREENKKIRELARIRQREEARIEEELLEDNLYPKTKNNKDL